MTAVLAAKFRLFLRKPWPFLAMTGFCIVFAFLFGGMKVTHIEIPVSSKLSEAETKSMLKELNQSDLFVFTEKKEEELKRLVRDGRSEAGLILEEDHFRIIRATHTPNILLLSQFVGQIYRQELLKKQLAENAGPDGSKDAERAFETSLSDPLFSVEKKSYRSDGTVVINTRLQSLFGFSLFFVIYTIAYNLLGIFIEKREKIWDRLIISSVKKWEIYAGNLIYGFLTGYVQVAIVFFVFRLAGVDFAGRLGEVLLVLIPYVLAIVALSVFIIGIVKTIEQFHAIIPLVSVAMAMIGGAYWPIEIVTSKAMLFLSKLMPIRYGMDLLKGVVIYRESLAELWFPTLILCSFGIAFTALGIGLMERKSAG